MGTGISSSSVVLFNSTTSGVLPSSVITGPMGTGPSSGISSSTTSGAPYGNGTTTTRPVGPTGVAPTGISTATPVNSTTIVGTSTDNSTTTAASSGFSSSAITSGGPYGNGTSSTRPFNPTAPSITVVSSLTSITTNSSSNIATATSSRFSSGISPSGAPYGNVTSSTTLIGPTTPASTSVLSSSQILTNSSTSAISASEISGPSSGFSSSASTGGAPYGNATITSLSLSPTVSVPAFNSSTSSILSSSITASNGSSTAFPSITVPSGPVIPITTGAVNGTLSSSSSSSLFINGTTSSDGFSTATTSGVSSSVTTTSSAATETSMNTTSTGISTATASSSISTDLGSTTSSHASSAISSTTLSEPSSVPTSTQDAIRSGSRVFIGPLSPAFKNQALESRQDGKNEYATVYTGRRQPPALGYTFNETSGHLYLGSSNNILSYEIPGFRSDSVQLATLTQDYLESYPTSWSPLQCSVTESTGALTCTAVSRSTRYRPRVTYSVFVAVPRSGQAAADIYLYAANRIDGRPLGATQVPLFLSMDGKGWPSKK
ncbi:hypothetical protein VTO58DRAFT_103939 [Aureobasidium pullulans]